MVNIYYGRTGVKRLKNLVVENWLFKNTGNLFSPVDFQEFQDGDVNKKNGDVNKQYDDPKKTEIMEII